MEEDGGEDGGKGVQVTQDNRQMKHVNLNNILIYAFYQFSHIKIIHIPKFAIHNSIYICVTINIYWIIHIKEFLYKAKLYI